MCCLVEFKMRLLRSYEHQAHKYHSCNNCELPICPGEFYQGEVYVTENHRIITRKYHDLPGCPEDPMDELMNKKPSDLEEELEIFDDVLKAA
jgi:hypothetical protein